MLQKLFIGTYKHVGKHTYIYSKTAHSQVHKDISKRTYTNIRRDRKEGKEKTGRGKGREGDKV